MKKFLLSIAMVAQQYVVALLKQFVEQGYYLCLVLGGTVIVGQLQCADHVVLCPCIA